MLFQRFVFLFLLLCFFCWFFFVFFYFSFGMDEVGFCLCLREEKNRSPSRLWSDLACTPQTHTHTHTFIHTYSSMLTLIIFGFKFLFPNLQKLSFCLSNVHGQIETLNRHKLIIDPNISHINLCHCCRPVLKQEQWRKQGLGALLFSVSLSLCLFIFISAFVFSLPSFCSVSFIRFSRS